MAKWWCTELAKRVIEGSAKLNSLPDLMAAYNKYTPGAEWNGAFYTDVATGVRAQNHVLIYQDTYVFGRGYMGTPDVVVPEQYFSIT